MTARRNTNLINVAQQYVQQLKAPVTKTTLRQSLEENPYYPSLYSLSNVFNRFKIANESFATDEDNLGSIEPPFITYCSKQRSGKDFVLVTEITGTTVSYLAEGKKAKEVSRIDFMKQWQKIVFLAEANAQSGENEYELKLRVEKIKKHKQAILYTGIALLASLVLYSFISKTGVDYIIEAAAITMTKLLGVAVTALLLVYEVDKTNSFVKGICTAAGKQTNCDAVLNSRAGKILGMSWGEVGFFYFASTMLFLLLPGQTFTAALPWVAIASTVASPYILFSIYYQWKVVKQWCILCLAVQTLLAIELVWAISDFWLVQNSLHTSSLMSFFNPFPWQRIVLILLFPPIAWYLLKPLILAAKDARGYLANYKRLLYNPEIFNGLLQQQAAAPDGWQGIGIDIGNPHAAQTIIKVCNPYCGPCAQAHPVLEDIVRHNKNVKLKVIFTASNKEGDIMGKPVKHFLAIAAMQNPGLTEQAMDDWYQLGKKDYEVFAAKYPVNGQLNEQEVKIDRMKKWCDEAEIAFTPTIFINGYRLPETYSIEELKNIL